MYNIAADALTYVAALSVLQSKNSLVWIFEIYECFHLNKILSCFLVFWEMLKTLSSTQNFFQTCSYTVENDEIFHIQKSLFIFEVRKKILYNQFWVDSQTKTLDTRFISLFFHQ